MSLKFPVRIVDKYQDTRSPSAISLEANYVVVDLQRIIDDEHVFPVCCHEIVAKPFDEEGYVGGLTISGCGGKGDDVFPTVREQ